jgi:hypothetical protein
MDARFCGAGECAALRVPFSDLHQKVRHSLENLACVGVDVLPCL